MISAKGVGDMSRVGAGLARGGVSRVTVSPLQFHCMFIPPGRVSLSLSSRLLPLLLHPLPLPCGKTGAVH